MKTVRVNRPGPSASRSLFAVTILAALSACATIDYDYPRTASAAPANTGNTWLGRRFTTVVAGRPATESGFYPLLDGIDALSARLLLADKAERSIDTQYYLIKKDVTSLAFVDALLDAADRGVRVRFLLDDVFTTGMDVEMAALDSHPNFEIRIFNPFNRGAGGVVWAGLTNFGTINRRMHTKSFTVDNQVTIVGGRNIADEYFGAREDAKFGDLDVVAIGNISSDVSTMFDTFWNHSTALPVPAFARMPDDPAAELERLRERLKQSSEAILTTRYAGAVLATAAEFLGDKPDVFHWSPYTLVYDTPDKGIKSDKGPELAIVEPLKNALLAAQKEVIVLSPYFVPRKSGIALFSELEARGVRVIIVTNSLAANNHSSVHSGYAPSRKPLLRNGVELYEVRPDADVPGTEYVDATDAQTTMHTKAFVVDGRQVFVGSFNFDPRSANLNTESGVLIESEELGKAFSDTVRAEFARQTWQVFLDDKGRLRWRGYDDGKEVIFKSEPQATWGRRFAAAFMRIIPIRGQL